MDPVSFAITGTIIGLSILSLIFFIFKWVETWRKSMKLKKATGLDCPYCGKQHALLCGYKVRGGLNQLFPQFLYCGYCHNEFMETGWFE